MKCILHIGTEKTGTSVIQGWLYNSAEILEKEGIYTPRQFGRPNNWHFPVYFQESHDHYYLKKESVLSKPEKDAFFSDFSRNFRAEIDNASGCSHFIISSEHFHSGLTKLDEIHTLKQFLSNYFNDIRVVCYFREQADMAISRYSTFLKGAGMLELEEFTSDIMPENPYYNLLQMADKWSTVFGQENCIFRIYDRTRFPDADICKDFLNSLDIRMDNVDYLPMRHEKNKSLSRLQAKVFLEINRAIPYWQESGGTDPYNVKLKNKILEIESLKGESLSELPMAKISDRFHESNKELFRKYFPPGTSFEKNGGKFHKNQATHNEKADQIAKDLAKALLNEVAELKGSLNIPECASSPSEGIGSPNVEIPKLVSDTPHASNKARESFLGLVVRRCMHLSITRK